MGKAITTPQLCVVIRGGLELWIDADRRETLKAAIANPSARIIDIHGQLVNTFEIIGVFTPEAMEEKRRRKNGQWTCELGTWHDKGNVCECERRETVKARLPDGTEITYGAPV